MRTVTNINENWTFCKEVKRTEAMERMLYRNTVIGLIKQAGGAITEEMALELNKKLRRIPKPTEEQTTAACSSRQKPREASILPPSLCIDRRKRNDQ